MGELVIVLAIFVLLFGARRLPELADGMGKAIRNFKRGLNTVDEDVTPPAPPPKQVADSSSASTLEHAAEASRPAEPKG
jgi:sec-independent protein translocase protein TatA